LTNKVLITGAEGFTAHYLIGFLSQSRKHKLFFTDLANNLNYDNFSSCDLSEPQEVSDLISKVQPDQIYHLAGAFTNNYEIDYKSNFLSTKNICDALLKFNYKNTRMLLIGSSSEYGDVLSDVEPISENSLLHPISIYGLSKSFQTYLMDFYFRTYGLNLIMARTFNLIGKKISNKLFVGNVFTQIEDYKIGKISKIKVGSLQANRDYLEVEDAVRDYEIIMTKGCAGEIYNVGSGKLIKMSLLLEKLLKDNGLDYGVVEEANYVSSTIMTSFADISKLNKLKGKC